MSELKACPACFNNAPYRARDTDNDGFEFSVGCSKCEFRVDWFRSQDYADAAWNRRTPDPLMRELAEVIARADSALESIFSSSPQLGEEVRRDIGLPGALAKAKAAGVI